MHLAGWSPAKHLCLTVEITYQHKAWVNWIKKSLCAEKVDGIRLEMEENKGKKNKCRVNRWLRPVAEPESPPPPLFLLLSPPFIFSALHLSFLPFIKCLLRQRHRAGSQRVLMELRVNQR